MQLDITLEMVCEKKKVIERNQTFRTNVISVSSAFKLRERYT